MRVGREARALHRTFKCQRQEREPGTCVGPSRVVFLGALDTQGILREATEARATGALNDSARRQV